MRQRRRYGLATLATAGTMVVGLGVASACVPQRGDLEVTVLSGQSQTGVITGDGSSTPLEWCELLDPGEQAEADEGDEITVTVSPATEVNGCPDGDDRLPDGTYEIWVSNSGAQWGWSTTDHAPTDKWSIPKGQAQASNNEEPYGCFWDNDNQDPRTHNQADSQTAEIVIAGGTGSDSETFNLDLSQSANSDPNTWTPAVNAANWAAVLCIGNPEDQDTVGIFAPLRVTALNSTI